jgi:hypothetical protein
MTRHTQRIGLMIISDDEQYVRTTVGGEVTHKGFAATAGGSRWVGSFTIQ